MEGLSSVKSATTSETSIESPQKTTLQSIVLRVALVALAALSIYFAGLVAMGVLSFSSTWTTSLALLLSLSLGCIALFYAVFWTNPYPSSKSPSLGNVLTNNHSISSVNTSRNSVESTHDSSTRTSTPTSLTTPSTTSLHVSSSADTRHTELQTENTSHSSSSVTQIETQDETVHEERSSTSANHIQAQEEDLNQNRTLQPIQSTTSSTETESLQLSSTPISPTNLTNADPLNIVAFYTAGTTPNAPSQGGTTLFFTLNDYLEGRIAQAEVDNYLPWIFPTDRAPAGKEGIVPVLNEASISTFKTTSELQIKIVKALCKMLAYSGLDLNHAPTMITANPVISKQFTFMVTGAKIFCDFQYGFVPVPNIPKCHAHFSRMTGILSSLRLLGLQQYSTAFFKALSEIRNSVGTYQIDGKPIISDEIFQQWEIASGNVSQS